MIRILASGMGFASAFFIAVTITYAGFHDWRFAGHMDTFGWPEIAADIAVTAFALGMTGWLMVTELRNYGR